MSRTFKEEAYAERRNEILDAAQKLLYTKGYELMTIQDILDELKISKGAFYHYFNSKQALLEAFVVRALEQAEAIYMPIVEAPNLKAKEKFKKFFDVTGRWKTDNKQFFLALLRTWYKDDNAIVRQKMTTMGIAQASQALNAIIRQGVEEGIFSTPYPDKVGAVIWAILLNFGEVLVRMLLTDQPGEAVERCFEENIFLYTNSIERVLGAAPGSLKLIDLETMMEWVEPARAFSAAPDAS